MPQPFQHGLDKAHDAVHRVYHGYVGKLNPVTQEKYVNYALIQLFHM